MIIEPEQELVDAEIARQQGLVEANLKKEQEAIAAAADADEQNKLKKKASRGRSASKEKDLRPLSEPRSIAPA